MTRQLILSIPYRQFKKLLQDNCNKEIKVTAPFKVNIQVECYNDIDNAIKVILDVIDEYVCNDRYIEELHVYKKAIKRGKAGSLIVDVYN